MSEQSTSLDHDRPRKSKEIDLMQIAALFWQSRKLIALVTSSATVLAIVVSFMLPKYFKSTAIILPDTDKSRASSLGGISDLAALAGVSTGGDVSLVKLYPTIIRSESVLRSVLYAKYRAEAFKDSVNLLQYWQIEGKTPELIFEYGLRDLREQLTVSSDTKLNVVTMSIETREPQLSADILNTTIKELNRFILTKRTTNATEQRKWIEQRLVQVKGDLERAENTLKEFREKNRMVTGSPQLLLEQERLLRDVQLNSTIYIELKKQHELVKIEEFKSVPIINVLDYGRPPASRARPNRSMIVTASFLLSLCGAFSYVLLANRFGTRILQLKEELSSLVPRKQ